MDGVRVRPATPDDAATLLALMVEGFEGYRGFAPAGWEPAPPPDEAMRERLGVASHWCVVAEDDDGGVAGHVAFLDAADSGHPGTEPGLAHLWQMFARPAHWGTGLAPDLLGRAVAAARERGFTAMRLFTPAGQARARRFYEREGWSLVREFDDDRLGLRVAEYRREL